MSLPMRQRVLAAAAFATAVATGYVAGVDDDLTPGLEDAPAVVQARLSPAGAPPQGSARGVWPAAPAEALRAWGEGARGADADRPAAREATAVPRARTAAAAPVAPALPAGPQAAPMPPWRLIGRIDDGGRVRVLLATAERVHVVTERDTFEGGWHVERIDERGLELHWLPTGQRRQLAWEAS